MQCETRLGGVRDFREDLRVRSDDQLAVFARDRLAQMVALTARNEEHLVGVADDFIAHVPYEEPAIREARLELGREVFGGPSLRQRPAAQVLDERNSRIEQPGSARPRILVQGVDTGIALRTLVDLQ